MLNYEIYRILELVQVILHFTRNLANLFKQILNKLAYKGVKQLRRNAVIYCSPFEVGIYSAAYTSLKLNSTSQASNLQQFSCLRFHNGCELLHTTFF